MAEFTRWITAPWILLVIASIIGVQILTGTEPFHALDRTGLELAGHFGGLVTTASMLDGTNHLVFFVTWVAVFIAILRVWPVRAALVLVLGAISLSFGLTKAITSITSRLATSVRFSMAVDPIDDEIGKDHAIHVYRIVQEGINNILKHASATEAQVTIRAETGNLRITISDNGKGIPADQSTHPPARRGFGLAGMTERAKVLNGAVTIESTPGKGTVLTVLIPRLKKPS